MELTGPWQFRQVGAAPDAGPPAAGERWLPARVPGTVHTDLLDNGLIPDPFWGTNERDLQWIGERDWEYRSALPAADELLAHERIDLVFEGLDTYASVRLNDAPILEADNQYRAWRVPVKQWLHAGENTLVVRFRSALREGKAAHDRLGYDLPAPNDTGEPRVSMFTRKAPYHYGWDWGPRLVTSGIWRPVRLEAWDGARLDDLHVVTRSLSDERAELVVEATIEATRAAPGTLELGLAGSAPLARVEAALVPGSNVVRADLHIDHPQLWWPNGLGAPHLYTIEAALSQGSVARAKRQLRVGLRTLEVEHRPDAEGKSFRVLINGAPVFMKGANYIPQDSFLPRVNGERYERLLRAVRAANMNLLRVWGGGVYEDDRFYELCDQLGILVWQDFMFACSQYPSDAAFLDNVRQEARQVVRRLRNHPSLALWAGNNENEWAWRDWGWQQQLTEAQLAEQRAGYERLFHELLPEIVAQEDPGRFYTRSSPSANDDAVAPNQPGFGDMHYWGVWHSEEPYERYADNVSRFMSEYGFQSFPELATIGRFAAPEDWQLDSEVLRAHQRHPRGNQLIATYLERDFRKPRDFESFTYVSQVLQATVIQFAAEAHRRKMGYNGGSLYWQLDDCWPAASWSSIDYFGRWKALQYYARRFFAPVLVSVTEEQGRLRVYGISDRRAPTPARLALRLLDFEGNVFFEKVLDVSLGANSSQLQFEASAAEVLGDRARTRVVFAAELFEGGQRSSRSLFYFAKARELELPDPELRLERGAARAEGTSLELRARRLARAVWLSSPGSDGHFSDNYFDLLPGEQRSLEYEGPPAAQIVVRSLLDSY
ncbi:MAG TPA: glycoside hydrolase family 2 protein [Polyangiaceae bacterium]|nr:glycoside hydrolase family 2 protein [Polyangiaceae bacterium]